MPQTVTFLVGLPGSGKSSFLKQRAEVVFDDFHAGAFRDPPAFTATLKNGWRIDGMETEQAGNAVDQPIKKEHAAMGETESTAGFTEPPSVHLPLIKL